VLFKNRRQAGSLLAPQVANALEQERDFQPSSAVVVGLPNGGVLVAKAVALALGCGLDVVVSKTIVAPQNPHFLIGVVSSAGIAIVDKPSVDYFRVSNEYIEAQTEKLIADSRQLEERLLGQAGIQTRSPLAGKWVVVVGDGVATGMTARAVLRSMRIRKAAKLVLAAPVMSFHAYRGLKDECDQLIALCLPYDFINVGQFYDDFRQVNEANVISCLRQVAGATPKITDTFESRSR
jgi:putative phosphoribosyl transferase